MNILYHVLTRNLKNKNKCNESIEYEPSFGNKSSSYIGPYIDTSTVLTVRLR